VIKQELQDAQMENIKCATMLQKNVLQ